MVTSYDELPGSVSVSPVAPSCRSGDYLLTYRLFGHRRTIRFTPGFGKGLADRGQAHRMETARLAMTAHATGDKQDPPWN